MTSSAEKKPIIEKLEYDYLINEEKPMYTIKNYERQQHIKKKIQTEKNSKKINNKNER